MYYQKGLDQSTGSGNAQIKYTYHQHVDGNGNVVTGTTTSVSGGCFTSGSHNHTSACPTIVHEGHKHSTDRCPNHPIWVDWVPNLEPYWGTSWDCGKEEGESSVEYTCGNSPLNTWSIGCGKRIGEIEKVEIVYP